ncbi:MAG: hypothetical protein GX847_04480 [Clostridiales bacterium]|nr:hypothetical protein [Clostridiales bacterium]
MDYIKYHPLIGGDTEDIDKVPMFASPQKDSVSATSSLYLEEFVPHRYRLHAKKPTSMKDYLGYKIHCPYCGAVMDAVAPHIDQYKLAVYVCKKCN